MRAVFYFCSSSNIVSVGKNKNIAWLKTHYIVRSVAAVVMK